MRRSLWLKWFVCMCVRRKSFVFKKKNYYRLKFFSQGCLGVNWINKFTVINLIFYLNLKIVINIRRDTVKLSLSFAFLSVYQPIHNKLKRFVSFETSSELTQDHSLNDDHKTPKYFVQIACSVDRFNLRIVCYAKVLNSQLRSSLFSFSSFLFINAKR